MWTSSGATYTYHADLSHPDAFEPSVPQQPINAGVQTVPILAICFPSPCVLRASQLPHEEGEAGIIPTARTRRLRLQELK